MSVTCPQGHLSDEPDWCSVCGAYIGDPASAAPVSEPTAAPAPPDPDPAVPTMPCPVCGTMRLGIEQFCEECGHDFLQPGPTAAAANADEAAPTAPLDGDRPTWRAVIEADRAQYDRNAPDDIAFPSGLPERVVVLDRDCVHIGRRSEARRTHPEIDLAGPPEDTGVSRTHAELHRQADGSYALVDMGSVNGTTVNDDATPLPEGESRPLRHGDRILLGAWTRITIRRDPESD
jgi:hypothetical protein